MLNGCKLSPELNISSSRTAPAWRAWMFVGLVGILILGGCLNATSMQLYRPKNRDEEQILTTLKKIPAGIENKSLDILRQPYADDLYVGSFQRYLGVAGPLSEISVGKKELMMAYVDLFRAAKDLSVSLIDFHLTVTGDLAAAQARMELRVTREHARGEGGDKDLILNDVTWRLRRTPLGWKIFEEIYE